MPFLIDIYALAPERSVAAVERFLEHFVPHRVRADAEYSIKRGDIDSVAEFSTPEEAACFCEAHPDAEARAYWNNRDAGDPRSAHVFFLPVGGLVLGLSLAMGEEEDEPSWNRWLGDLKAFAGAEHGYWAGEWPPEDSVEAFIAKAQEARQTKRCV